MVAAVRSNPSEVLNKKLREALIKLRKEQEIAVLKAVADNTNEEALMTGMRAGREKNAAELCSLLKQFGWPSRAAVGEDGVKAAFSLLRNNAAFDLQVDLLPVIIAASEKGEIEKKDLAAYVDRLRVSSGLKQMFGTQATIIDGFLVLLPIEAEATLDQRRKDFGLVPLTDQIRSLERIYRLPLIRSTGTLTNHFTRAARDSVKATTSDLLRAKTDDEDEVVRVDTNLVSINVSVYSERTGAQVSELEQKDFRLTEDGRPQEISFFASTDVPFDLILVLDLSGSTLGKRDLIRKSTKRFIEATRASDRVAIVTFASFIKVIAPLTDDRTALFKSASKIEGSGGSRIWDALKFTLSEVVAPKSANRRTAIVFMTDGLDGSQTPYSDLLEVVRTNDALIIPVYLDGSREGKDLGPAKRMFDNARNSLKLLAHESGGFYHEARKVEDLDGVYERVIADLGKIYSVGYRSDDQKRDGSWRQIKIEIPGRPGLKPHSRPGYYAK